MHAPTLRGTCRTNRALTFLVTPASTSTYDRPNQTPNVVCEILAYHEDFPDDDLPYQSAILAYRLPPAGPRQAGL